ncbi:MAG: HEAT repeat domain-containing protein [Thermoleophilia bacterium]|nr:HEAT repeat domain-containing protein [Thermoleophilia bacterium]
MGPKPLEILLIFIAVEAAALFGLLIAVVWQSLWGIGTRRERQIRLWVKALDHALAGRRCARNRIRRTLKTEEDIIAFQRFLHEHCHSLKVDSWASLRQLLRALGVTTWLHTRFREARKDLERASAARTLAYLKEPLDPEEVATLLDSKDPAAVLAAAHALTSLGNPDYVVRIFRAVYDRTPITLHGAAGLLSRLGPGVCPTITRILADVLKRIAGNRRPEQPTDIDHTREIDPNDVAAQVVLVDLLAFFRYTPAGPVLRRLLMFSPHDEVVIHLVKALGALRDNKAIPLLKPLLEHENWVVRSQTAKALAAIESSLEQDETESPGGAQS